MAAQRVRVWDWSIRVFHWVLVLMIAGMWWTAEQGYMQWHKWLGARLTGLLVYRLVWGIVGPKTARLHTLIPRVSALVDYLKSLRTSKHRRSFGHSPLGGLAVLTLLGLLWVQTGTGLFSVDVNGLASGWFGHWISFDLGRNIADIHEQVFDLLLAMIGLHLLAIAGYAIFLRTNLVTPMITGKQDTDDASERNSDVTAPVARVMIALVLAACSIAGIVWLGR